MGQLSAQCKNSFYNIPGRKASRLNIDNFSNGSLFCEATYSIAFKDLSGLSYNPPPCNSQPTVLFFLLERRKRNSFSITVYHITLTVWDTTCSLSKILNLIVFLAAKWIIRVDKQLSKCGRWTQGTPETLSKGLKSQNYFHHNTKMLFAFFTVLTFTVRMQSNFGQNF